MLHYEYIIKKESEKEILKKNTEIDYDYNGEIIFSITKKQLRKIKLGALESNREYTILKRIIFESKIVNVQYILEKKIPDIVWNEKGF